MASGQAGRILPDYQNKGVSFYLRSQGILQTLQKVPTLKLFSSTTLDASTARRRENDSSRSMFMRYVSITIMIALLLLKCSSPQHQCRLNRKGIMNFEVSVIKEYNLM